MDDLTVSQRQAVEHVDGPLLILAGPGSGKTRVVTRRIAHLVEAQRVSTREILAITFTNKAAQEMSERVHALLPGKRVWVSTFHRLCARLLREYGDVVGLSAHFSILDSADQKHALRLVLEENGYDASFYSPNKVGHRISNIKNDLLSPERYLEQTEGSLDQWHSVLRRVYPAYQKWLLEANSVDFDDLLLHTALLLHDNEELRRDLDERFRYILVDEYQDTNIAQYQIVASMSQQQRNLCVTGDPDQSIYGWRGARIQNILRFEQDYSDAVSIRLEENFRSTQAILRCADSLIINNTQRKAKSLISVKGEGAPVQLLIFPDSRTEAEAVGLMIREMIDKGNYRWDQIAIFYRVNALSRQLELEFMRQQIPYQVAAGTAFYDRAEIKDLIAYLRLVENPADQAAFSRIVNKPLRGLGKTSQQRLLRFAEVNRLTLLEAAKRATQVERLSKRAQLGFKRFAEMVEGWSLADAGSVASLLREIVESTRFTIAWEGSPSETDRDKLANVEELIAAAQLYDEAMGEEISLQGFLEQTALVNETDWIQEDAGRVTLMTLHAAKGLEFPVAFIIGVEEGLIPHERSQRESSSHHEFEEERRLLFVGITRAEEQLFLTESRTRSMHGKTVPTIRSPFISELECEIVDFERPTSSIMQAPPQRRNLPTTGIKLTTAANLLNGEKVAVDIPQGFGIGMQVRHSRYGRGVITGISGFGKAKLLTVQFEDNNTRTFTAAEAPLQPIGVQ